MEVLFGPWARYSALGSDGIAIEPLPTARATIAALEVHPRFSQGWLYPPLEPPIGDSRRDAPLVPAKAYTLPTTHRLTLNPPFASDEAADFFIALTGMLEGVRLTREGWKHFLKAPLELHKVGDLICDKREISEVLKIASESWLTASGEIRLRLFGAVHLLVFSGLYEYDFERFAGAYSVLDTLYWVFCTRGGPKMRHATRASGLAEHFGMPVPAWAVLANNSCALSELRNQLVHEARYAGAPTGFAYPADYPMISMELDGFVRRMLLTTLGVRCGYVTSAVTMRQMHGLDLVGRLPAV